MEKGRLPLDQALEYAIEIADALDKAHRQGVVHRDLKPGNIMITKAGTKLLDFGLAQLKARSAPLDQWSTIEEQEPLTAEGEIAVGTLQYMAPEQLEGKEADARTDIFAFGTTVYEMVTGKKAFQARRVIGEWIDFYNAERPHSALGGKTPAEAYRGDPPADMMDKPLRALPTYPQAQQRRQEDRSKDILAR